MEDQRYRKWDIVDGPPNEVFVLMDGEAYTWIKGIMYCIHIVTEYSASKATIEAERFGEFCNQKLWFAKT